ncbi:MAG: hypothetical protein IT306_16575 [Chloroflexi bacterium]|nr:hypothetical protein [Chloroflexota bacterium]
MKRLAVLTAFVVVSLFAALAPPSTPTQAQAGCFPETGFCITNQQFAEYFRLRGGVRIMGYPISRSFTLEGFEVQFFQRVILQLQGGQVQRLNILDPNVMPMTRANQSVFPGPDPAIASQAPQVGSSDYARQVVEFVRRVAPDTFNGQPVGFFNLFNTTVPVDIAFAGQTPNPDLVTLLNLEIWGLPTSNPAPDPGNGGFIYQRFQRGIMHYQAQSGATEGILVGEYLKSVITGRSLPPDLAADMAGSRFNAQYSPGAPGWTARPGELQGTDMTNAFEPGSGNVTPPPAQPTQPPAAGTVTPTATAAAAGPTVTIQVDDDLIDPGQSISITVIARYATAIDWLEFDGIESENNNENDNDASDDPALARQRFDCDDRTECANVWSVSPTRPGRYTLRARAEGTDDVRSEWVTIPFRVRDIGATSTPTTGPSVTPTTAATSAPTSAPTSTPTSAATAVPTSASAPAATATTTP